MSVAALSKSLVRLGRREDREEEQRPLDFRLICRLFQYTRPYTFQRNALLVLVLIRAFQLPALTWLITAIIQGPIQNHDTRGVLWGAISFLLLALSTQWVMHYRQRYALELGEAVVRDLRNALFSHIQSMPMSWFQQTRVGRVISRMASDVEDVRMGVQDVLFVCLVQLGQMLVAAACMIYYDSHLFLLVFALAPLIGYINHIFHRRLSSAMRDMRESFSRVTATLVESVGGIRVTQGFVRQEENARMFAELAADHSRYNTAVMQTQGLFVPLLEMNGQLGIALLLLVGGYRVLQGDAGTDLGDLVGFFFMANLFFSPVSVLGNQYHQAMTAMAGAERVFGLLDTPPAWRDRPDALVTPPLRGRVEFRDVTFGYAPDNPVLHHIHLTASPGETIALVGQTGSGKSSIINLIAKFYLPQSGEVLIDGHNLNDLRSDSLHQQLGIVLQHNFLFQGTVADNIRMGKPGASDQEICRVIERLDCTDILMSLPEGLETRVGERGASLSAGQRQLVCFARALLADPRILILDEATSSIDTRTEARLQKALSVLLRGRTSFVVAHRLSTIRQADQILVLDQGRIVEQGPHAVLIRRQGPYARLNQKFTSQAGAAFA